MIRVKLHKSKMNKAEDGIATMLYGSLKSELQNLECPCCDQNSEVLLHVNKAKMSVIHTTVIACCTSFESQIKNRMHEPA